MAVTGARIVIGLLVAVAVCTPIGDLADAADQHEQVEQELETVRKGIELHSAREEERAQKIRKLMEEVRALDARLLTSSRNSRTLQADESELEAEFQAHRDRLDTLEQEYTKQRTLLARRLSSIYKRGRFGSSRVLLQAATSSEPLRMARYLAAVSKADSAAFADYESVRRRHETAIADLEAQRQRLTDKQVALAEESKRYESTRGEKKTLLANVEKDLAADRSKLERLKATETELQKVLAATPPSEPEAVELAARVEPERETDTRGGQPGKRPQASDEPGPLARLFRSQHSELPFRKRQGDLQVPVRGTIVARFGERPLREGPKLQGVLVSAGRDYQITAVAGGEVVFAGPFPGLGNTLIINHGDRYHSVYAHLDSIQYEVGARVKENQIVGSVSKSNPTLHFELRAEGKALNPEPWFRGGYAAFQP